MLNPAADANSSARAPNCTVFDVSAKYASHLIRGLSPVARLIAIRSSFGNPAGGLNAGCNPPTDSAKFGDPAKYSVGVRYVLVAGVAVVSNGELQTGIAPGRAVRGPIKN